jgi:transcriptional antiterminator
MDTFERDEKLQQLKYLIIKNTTGTAKVIAKEIDVSRRTVFRLMDHLRIREQQNIKFCKKRNCYYFTDDE